MISAILSRIVILGLGTLYPAYASYKAVKTKNVKEYVKWMMYWIVFALFTFIETLADTLVSWLPFYYELKIVFVLWLLSPATNGSSILYRKFVHPQLSKREKEIDSCIAKASEQGYSAFITLGSKGISYATNVLVSTAVKGQAKIADHIKKSYSLGDLSSDNPSVDFRDTVDRINEEDDDELDNKMLEERYNHELQEMGQDQTDSKVARRTGAHRVQQKAHEAEQLYPVEESDELGTDNNRTKSSRTRKYDHKDAAHYGTLPRSRNRQTTRPTIPKVN